MRKDEARIGAAAERARDHQAGDGASGVLRIFECGSRDAGLKAAAAVRHGGMEIDDGLATVEFVEDGLERGLSGPLVSVTGEYSHAVCFEVVESVGQFREAAFGIRKGQGREESEAVFVAGGEFGGVFVALAGELAGRRNVAEPDGRRGE